MHKRTLGWQLVRRQPHELHAAIDPSWQVLDWQSIRHECAARRVGHGHPTPRRPPAASPEEEEHGEGFGPKMPNLGDCRERGLRSVLLPVKTRWRHA
eukprot:scaffold57565_cov63-Phaeocystis_antarctica.AAC.2